MNNARVPIAAQIKQAKTPAEELRDTLSTLEALIGKLGFAGTGGARDILQLFDRADELMQALEERGAVLTGERLRFSTLTQTYRRKGHKFLKEIGGVEALKELRQAHPHPADNWWWNIDRILSDERRVRQHRSLRTVGIVVVVLAVIAGFYMAFLRPDADTRARYRYEVQAESALMEDDPTTALENVEQALVYAPGDEDLLVLKAVALMQLERETEAEAILVDLREAFDDEITYRSALADTYMSAGRPESALEEAEAMIALDEGSALGYYHMGRANAMLGNYYQASLDYEKAGELAHADGNAELEGMARVQLANLMMLMMSPDFDDGAATPEPASPTG